MKNSVYKYMNPGDGPEKLALPPEAQTRFLYLIHKLQEAKGYGADLMENAIFTELMVLVNRLYGAGEEISGYRHHPVVESIIAYINSHIGEKITLSVLAESMFLSQAYICRIFKAETGTSINKYITARRISIAKARLGAGFLQNLCRREAGMKNAISLWQPWAGFSADGTKRVETRGWATNFRGQMFIHATQFKKLPHEVYLEIWKALGCPGNHGLGQVLEYNGSFLYYLEHGVGAFGALLGSVDIFGCVPIEKLYGSAYDTPMERALGDWRPGRYGWLMRGHQKLQKAIPMKGKQGIWSFDESLLEGVNGL